MADNFLLKNFTLAILGLAVVILVVGSIIFPVVEGSSVGTFTQVCPLH
jgi:hypothetical protein